MMNSMLQLLISQTDGAMDEEIKVREAMQRIAVCSLARSEFFNGAALVGGTALRLFHGLDRSSEDIHLTLLQPNRDFDFERYIGPMKDEFGAFGLSIDVKKNDKSRETKMKDAFSKGESMEFHLRFGISSETARFDQRPTIGIEVDVDPPQDYRTEWMYGQLPFPHNVRLYDLPTMFACKLHAVLCRGWGNRVKGRDYYDVLYYSSRGTPVNTKHLIARLAQSGIEVSGEQGIRDLLRDRFSSVDYADASKDAEPFVFEKRRLRNWSPELFMSVADGLRFV